MYLFQLLSYLSTFSDCLALHFLSDRHPCLGCWVFFHWVTRARAKGSKHPKQWAFRDSLGQEKSGGRGLAILSPPYTDTGLRVLL